MLGEVLVDLVDQLGHVIFKLQILNMTDMIMGWKKSIRL